MLADGASLTGDTWNEEIQDKMRRICIIAATSLDTMTSKSGFKQALSNLYLIKDVLAENVNSDKLSKNTLMESFLCDDLGPTLMSSMLNC